MSSVQARAYAHAAGGAWSVAILQFVMGVILARSLRPHDLGTYVFGTAIAAFIFGIFDIRVEEGLTQFFIREKSAGTNARIASALRYAVGIDVFSGLMIFALTLAALTVLPLHLSHQTQAVAMIAALTSLVAVSDGSFTAILYADHAFAWLSMYQIVLNGARCAALAVLPITKPTDAAWAIVLGQAAGTAFLITIVAPRVPLSTRGRAPLDSADRRWLLRFSIHVAASSALATVRTTALPLVLGAAGTKQEVAEARVAESPTRLVGVAGAPLRTVLFPRLSSAWARRDHAGARRLIRQYVGTSLLLGGMIGSAMALTMGFILTRIYGAAYGDLERVGQFFVLAALLDAVAGWQKVAPAAFDRPWLRTFILAGESAALLVALVVLVPPYGALGAAISAAVAGAISLAMGAYWLRPALAKDTWRSHRASPRSPEQA